MSLSSHPFPGDLAFLPVLENLHVILFCQATVFETVPLEVSRDAIFVQDHAKFSGGIDLCRVQTTHTLEILRANAIRMSLIQLY